ncbi:MAG: leucine-rich repeat domain-containing protein [Promethearchaeota archaeon]|nr:MAG: leucine-rich repeat domain-containing protein [Candidatus Lokiarchaeota archaeon]
MNWIYITISFLMISVFSFSVVISKIGNRNRYQVNKYLTLKLENHRTFIYVNNRRFTQCMYLLMNIPKDKMEHYSQIDSIDEAAESLDRSHEGNPSLIEPRTEFWGHCSNIQAWAENDYDTRLLHRNLAFPLLKRLVEAGDPKAKRVFKEEIAIRLSSRHQTVFNYLYLQGYLKYLDLNELESVFDDIDLPIINQTANTLNIIFKNNENPSERFLNRNLFSVFKRFSTRHIPFIYSKIKKGIDDKYQDKIVKLIYEKYKSRAIFPKIQFINDNIKYFDQDKFTFVKYGSKIIGIIQEEEKLSLINKRIQNIRDITGLKEYYKKIKELDLSTNLITDLKGIEEFTNLMILKLNGNLLQNVDGLKNLSKLEELYLRNNRLKNAINFEHLSNLKYLDLSGNRFISEIPLSISNLPRLEKCKVWNCNIRNVNEKTIDFFWNTQNYRYFRGYNQEDINYYEKTHKAKALSHVDNGLYKHFTEWVLKMKKRMQKYNFSYEDLEQFEQSNPELNPIWSGRLTNAFKKWLSLRYQMKITDFF